jgi:hypothetical protein
VPGTACCAPTEETAGGELRQFLTCKEATYIKGAKPLGFNERQFAKAEKNLSSKEASYIKNKGVRSWR